MLETITFHLDQTLILGIRIHVFVSSRLPLDLHCLLSLDQFPNRIVEEIIGAQSPEAAFKKVNFLVRHVSAYQMQFIEHIIDRSLGGFSSFGELELLFVVPDEIVGLLIEPIFDVADSETGVFERIPPQILKLNNGLHVISNLAGGHFDEGVSRENLK